MKPPQCKELSVLLISIMKIQLGTVELQKPINKIHTRRKKNSIQKWSDCNNQSHFNTLWHLNCNCETIFRSFIQQLRFCFLCSIRSESFRMVFDVDVAVCDFLSIFCYGLSVLLLYYHNCWLVKRKEKHTDKKKTENADQNSNQWRTIRWKYLYINYVLPWMWWWSSQFWSPFTFDGFDNFLVVKSSRICKSPFLLPPHIDFSRWPSNQWF